MSWDRDLPCRIPIRRKATIQRSAQLAARNAKRAARRDKEYRAFIQGPQWRAQKRRVHERDGWRCTEHRQGQRCPYSKADGPLHAHHDRYHPRGIQYTPDADIRTVCPHDHDRLEAAKWWRQPKSY